MWIGLSLLAFAIGVLVGKISVRVRRQLDFPLATTKIAAL